MIFSKIFDKKRDDTHREHRPFSCFSEKAPDRRQPQKPSAEIKTSLCGRVGHAKSQKAHSLSRCLKYTPHLCAARWLFFLTLAARSIVPLSKGREGHQTHTPHNNFCCWRYSKCVPFSQTRCAFTVLLLAGQGGTPSNQMADIVALRKSYPAHPQENASLSQGRSLRLLEV